MIWRNASCCVFDSFDPAWSLTNASITHPSAQSKSEHGRSRCPTLEHADPRIHRLALQIQENDLMARRPFAKYDSEDDVYHFDYNVEVNEMDQIIDSRGFEGDQTPF